MKNQVPKAIIKPHFYKERTTNIIKITKKWIMVYCNDFTSGLKYDRLRGHSAGAFQGRSSMTPNTILNLYEINKFADANGGTWDSGWKPKKSEEQQISKKQEDTIREMEIDIEVNRVDTALEGNCNGHTGGDAYSKVYQIRVRSSVIRLCEKCLDILLQKVNEVRRDK